MGKKNGGSGPAHWKIKNMENSMISEKNCAGPDVFSWGFSASDKDRFFADFSKNRKTVKKAYGRRLTEDTQMIIFSFI